MNRIDTPIELDAVRQRLHRAAAKLLTDDRVLLEVGVGEPTVSARLMHYLVGEFPDWDVDAEYNKRGTDRKQVPLPDNPEAKIRPDVVVHHRGRNDNLLAVEVKKSRSGHHQHDRVKLESCTKPGNIAYRLGAHVIFQPPTIQWFENGAAVGEREPFAL